MTVEQEPETTLEGSGSDETARDQALSWRDYLSAIVFVMAILASVGFVIWLASIMPETADRGISEFMFMPSSETSGNPFGDRVVWDVRSS
jgi:hypothetical protein